jgi:hypothetical protein
MNAISRSTVIFLAALLLAACQEAGNGDNGRSEAPAAGDTAAEREPAELRTSAGKPTAPVGIDYAIIGMPVVGQPLNINLELSSSLRNRPVTLNYRINDPRNLSFPQAQAQSVALAAFGDADRVTQQVTVVPQREGRLYLNVHAEVETEDGTLLKSIAIPIQVGRAPRQQEPDGKPREGPDGETVISLPAKETTR